MNVIEDFEARFPDEISFLQAEYSADGRYYHNWSHIEALLRWFSETSNQIADREAVLLAIYYHDVIYNPFAIDNEFQSAELLSARMSGRIDAKRIENAYAMINATAGHQLPAEGGSDFLNDCSYFLDMDISILGARRDVYDLYEENIRKEYEAVPTELFKSGRAKILQEFLERDYIYFTQYFRIRLESDACENLIRAIGVLT